MAFQLSPGVNFSEIDLTTIVPAVGTTEGAYAGRFQWGPCDEIMVISNESDLARIFGKPNADTYVDFFTCANFLSYARNLKVVRASNTSMKNASAGSPLGVANNLQVLIKNNDDYELNYLDMSGDANIGMFSAKYPGAIGNSLKVSYFQGPNAIAFAAWSYAEEFNTITGTSTLAATRGGSNDEIHIVVVDKDGKISGIANTVLEKFSYLSVAGDSITDDGSSNYYVNVLNDRSEFIYAMNHPSDTTNWGSVAAGTSFNVSSNSATVYTLSGGSDATVTTADRVVAYDKFANGDEVDVSLVISGNASTTLLTALKSMVESRKDCVLFASPEFDDVIDNADAEVTDINSFRDSLGSSSYVVMDSGWKYQFDKYNNVYRWIPLNGDIAGLCVRTDYERDPWYSPAGFNRGQIKNLIKLAWSPTKAERDELYKNGVNPVVNFHGEGTILYGDKTLLAKPSAFDRINVRRLFIVLEKAISRAAKYSLFEFNDAFTRAQFVALVEPYLRDVQGRRGIFDFRVVCDETNNTPEVIDRNEFVGDIYIKPARSINFIQLNFVAVRTGVAFEEVVGKF
jgi:Phage tail sheath protein subtilisin-like domain/Phage tail sheath C-terminal domain